MLLLGLLSRVWSEAPPKGGVRMGGMDESVAKVAGQKRGAEEALAAPALKKQRQAGYSDPDVFAANKGETVTDTAKVTVDSNEPEAPTELSNKRQRQKAEKKKREKREPLPCIYGNYQRYYGYRRAGEAKGSLDPRVDCLQRSWIENKRVVDIGCNSGLLTLQVAKKWKPSRMEGFDIDGTLVDAARKRIRGAKKRGNGAECPMSFLEGDFLREERVRDGSVGCVLCMSVVKWIHLHNGDEGLKELFQKAWRILESGGVFVLEVQPWTSYRKNKSVSEATRKNFSEIKLRPDRFPSLLEECGFLVEELQAPEQAKGFKRPIYACTKPTGGGEVQVGQ